MTLIIFIAFVARQRLLYTKSRYESRHRSYIMNVINKAMNITNGVHEYQLLSDCTGHIIDIKCTFTRRNSERMAMATDKGVEVEPDCEERPSPPTSLMTTLKNTAKVRLL